MVINKILILEAFSCLQTRTVCDHARHLYYKFRAGGFLSYTAVSASTINSNQQVYLLPCTLALWKFCFSLLVSLTTIFCLSMGWSGFRVSYSSCIYLPISSLPSNLLLLWLAFLLWFINIVNNTQFSNTLQSKVPAFLGGMSVCICFVAAAMSLGISFLIIPRQVTPWTGLLLMYEWTFTLFFLLFANYLHVIYRWGRIVGNQAGAVSTRPESLDYDSGKGLSHWNS